MYITVVIIIYIINKAWLWKNINCSLIGDALSCSLRDNHVVLLGYNGSFNTSFVELKSNALICHSELCELVIEMVGSSEYLCSACGKFYNHSTEFLVCMGNKICRFDAILFHMMKMNIITLTNELVCPFDEMMFHVV